MDNQPKVKSDVNEDRDVVEYTVDVEEILELINEHGRPRVNKTEEKKHTT